MNFKVFSGFDPAYQDGVLGITNIQVGPNDAR